MLSIIVPVYNTEKYLRQCIDSILKQTYQEFELVLVDDGSRDGSPRICDEYARLDQRIKVLHKKNGGARSALIEGVKISSGDYIGFVDSDDWIEPNMYKTLMYYMLTENVDCAMCRHKFYDERTQNISLSSCIEEKIYEGDDDIKSICNRAARSPMRTNWLSLSRCNKVFKRKIIYENIISTDSSLAFGEDIAVVYPALVKCRKFYFSAAPLYVYRKGIESVTGGNFKESYYQDIWKLRVILENNGKYLCADDLNGWIFCEIVSCIRQISNSTKKFAWKRKSLKDIMEDPRLKKLIVDLRHTPMTKRNKFIRFSLRVKFATLLLIVFNLKHRLSHLCNHA